MAELNPAPETPALSVVIPALNEEARLPHTMREVTRFLGTGTRFTPAELVIVDDGSTDHTAAVVHAFPQIVGIDVVLLQHRANRGKGAAVRTGFARARGRQVLLCDADLATPIDEILKLDAVASPTTVAIGSRAVDRRLISVRQPLYRDFMGRVFNRIERSLVVAGVADTQCGFKLYPGWLARQLATVQRIDGFAFDVEHLLLARRWGYRLVEVGVLWHHVEASRVQAVRHSLQMFRDVMRLAWRRASGSLPEPPVLADDR